jgi:hypothetical protein
MSSSNQSTINNSTVTLSLSNSIQSKIQQGANEVNSQQIQLYVETSVAAPSPTLQLYHLHLHLYTMAPTSKDNQPSRRSQRHQHDQQNSQQRSTATETNKNSTTDDMDVDQVPPSPNDDTSSNGNNTANAAPSSDKDVDATGRKCQKVATAPASILRSSIRARHTIIRNPYTPSTLRTCSRAEALSNPNTSTSRSIKTYNTQWRSRFAFKVNIPASNNAVKKFQETVQSFLHELQATTDDSTIACILPWSENDRETIDSLTSADEVPSTITKLQKYFPNVYPGNGQAHVAYMIFPCFRQI